MHNTAFAGDPSDFTTTDDTFEMGTQAAALDVVASATTVCCTTASAMPRSTSMAPRELGSSTSAQLRRAASCSTSRVHDVDALAAGYAIGGDDLGAATRAGVTVTTGDIALVRTGNMKLLRSGDKTVRRGTHPVSASDRSSGCTTTKLAAIATDTRSRCGR